MLFSGDALARASRAVATARRPKPQRPPRRRGAPAQAKQSPCIGEPMLPRLVAELVPQPRGFEGFLFPGVLFDARDSAVAYPCHPSFDRFELDPALCPEFHRRTETTLSAPSMTSRISALKSAHLPERFRPPPQPVEAPVGVVGRRIAPGDPDQIRVVEIPVWLAQLVDGRSRDGGCRCSRATPPTPVSRGAHSLGGAKQPSDPHCRSRE